MRAPPATMSGGRWLVGSFEQTLPPIVPRFRTWTSAIVAQTSPRIGRAFASAGATRSEEVVIAPIVSVPSPASSIPRSSSSPSRSTSMSGEAARAFITLISVWPPASARAPSFAASSSKASATDPGFAYSTSRSSTSAILQRGVNAGFRVLQPSAGATRARGEDLAEHRDGGLRRRVRADVEPRRPGDPIELVVGDSLLAQEAAAALLVAPRADPPDVEGIAREGGADQRQVELVVVREHDHRGAEVGLDGSHRLVRPGHEQLVGARDPVGRGEARSRIGHDGLPAEQLRRATQRLGRVDRPVDEEASRRGLDVREDGAILELEHVAAGAAARLLLELRVVEPLADTLAGDDRQRHIRPLRLRELLDEDVDLTAARKADPKRHLVRDSVGDEARLAACEHLLCSKDDVALDAAARDGAGELAALAHRELRPDRPRRRAAGGDDSGDGDLASELAPATGLRQHALHRPQSSARSATEVGLAQVFVLA